MQHSLFLFKSTFWSTAHFLGTVCSGPAHPLPAQSQQPLVQHLLFLADCPLFLEDIPLF